MGADKGLLPASEGTWAQAAVHKMLALQLPVALSVNAGQLRAYSLIFPTLELIVDDHELSLAGPLLALLTIHEHKPKEDLLILACDMPLIQTDHLRQLLDQQGSHPAYDAYVFTNDGAFEPLCGLYTAKGLSALMDQLRQGTLKRFSMKHALGQLHTFSLPIPNDQKAHFSNLNSPDDLKQLPGSPDQTPSPL
jgi:molybdopterin-guanine dinucleotide biosynthesis protein A